MLRHLQICLNTLELRIEKKNLSLGKIVLQIFPQKYITKSAKTSKTFFEKLKRQQFLADNRDKTSYPNLWLRPYFKTFFSKI